MRRKTLITTIVMLLVAMTALSALSLKAGLGAISSLDVSFNHGRWDFSAGLRSSVPVIPTAGYAVAPKLLERDISFPDWAGYSCMLFNGIGADASLRLVNDKHHTFSLGLSTAFGLIRDPEDGVLNILPDYENILLAVLEFNAQYAYNINEKHSIFLSLGFPFLGWIDVMGVPGNNNAYSIMSFIAVPQTFRQIEEGGRMEGITEKAVLISALAPVKIGYIYRF
ncbi:MAG: hypothetical protein IJR16_04460 [Spirochaetales bacterium]|nr:hypothetical protein [Spirochaetales bacterium]